MHVNAFLRFMVDFKISVYFKFITWGAILMVSINIVKYNYTWTNIQ